MRHKRNTSHAYIKWNEVRIIYSTNKTFSMCLWLVFSRYTFKLFVQNYFQIIQVSPEEKLIIQRKILLLANKNLQRIGSLPPCKTFLHRWLFYIPQPLINIWSATKRKYLALTTNIRNVLISIKKIFYDSLKIVLFIWNLIN